MKKNSVFKILVVDDEREMLHNIESLLKQENYHVYTVTDGQECLQAIHNDKPDLILLDLILPDLSGLDVCKTIKNDPSLSSIHILLLSGLKTESDSISEGLETGADGYLIKPIQKRELLARIEAVCRTIRVEKDLRKILSLTIWYRV